MTAGVPPVVSWAIILVLAANTFITVRLVIAWWIDNQRKDR